VNYVEQMQLKQGAFDLLEFLVDILQVVLGQEAAFNEKFDAFS